MSNVYARSIAGEIIGTFLMCFFGIGAVANATFGVSGAFGGPFQVGMVWGITIAIAIYVTRNLSAAHFNPAVSFAMLVTGNMNFKEFVVYVVGQFIGAFLAAAMLWCLFGPSAMAAGMDPASASIWAEITPNSLLTADVLVGTIAEGFGVFLLVFVIFSLTSGENMGAPNSNLFPLFIGLTVTMIICTVGPITDAGLNPARDLGPRFLACIVGFEGAISPTDIIIYTVGPLVGGALAGFVYTYIVKPLHIGACKAAENTQKDV